MTEDSSALRQKPEISQTLVFRRVRKMRKATISFVVSVCLPARNNSTPSGRILMKFDIWVFFESGEKIQLWLKYNKNKGSFAWRETCVHLWYPAEVFSEWQMFQVKVVEKNAFYVQ
jgi:hypothetical protein